ncbi:MAG TPA: UPF0236 family protein, partial [Myxococcales bacterium]
MTRKKGLRAFSKKELLEELARRHADEVYRDDMTMSEIELAVEKLKGDSGDPGIEALLRRMKPEKPTGKACPKCGKRIPVKARDRERTVRSLSGPVSFKRNYHYCEECRYGFYPVDRLLSLPEEGELTSEMEKRVLDFAINDVYGECAARWNLHYQQPISENLLRRVIARVGAQCEAADQGQLQHELKPAEDVADVLIVESDGSLLPIRGPEPWKEAKVGVVYRHDREASEPIADSARYVAVVNGLGEFAPVLEEALHVERIEEVPTVVWVGDGAVCNWTLADQLAPDAIQILDWHHAVEHAVDCGKVLLGEESPWLLLWQQRAQTLLSEGLDRCRADGVHPRGGEAATGPGRGAGGAQQPGRLLPQQRETDELPPAARGGTAHRQRCRRERASPRAADADETRRATLVAAQRPPDGPTPRRLPHRGCARLLRRDPAHD